MSELVELRSLREDIGEYILPNGIRLNVRVLLLFAWKLPNGRKLEVRTHNAYGVAAPAKLQGPPTKVINPSPATTLTFKESDLKLERRPQSIYQVGDDIIVRIVHDVRSVSMTDSYDQYGEPLLLVNASQQLEIIPFPPAPLHEENRQAKRREMRRAQGK